MMFVGTMPLCQVVKQPMMQLQLEGVCSGPLRDALRLARGKKGIALCAVFILK
jgi:hypothetical protein